MLPKLIPDYQNPTGVQQTTFAHDVFGRFTCSTWNEVANNGGAPFDVVVIGAGMFGAYCAEKIYRLNSKKNLRILVLDAGAFLYSTHFQNLPHMGVGFPDLTKIPPVTSNQSDPGPTNIVWGFPWHSDQVFPGLAYNLGGRSLFWGGWAPQLTAADLAQWPNDLATYLSANYGKTENEIGVKPKTDYLTAQLYKALKPAFDAAAGPLGSSVDVAPLAIQGNAPAPGLFSFDKYSSANLLIDALREDIAARWAFPEDNSRRLLMFMPRANVVRLLHDGGKVTGMELFVDGQYQVITAPLLAADCAVVLANSTIESTRLALESFPVAGMGANLMGHLRSNLTVKLRRSAFPTLPANPAVLETAAFIVRGTTNGRQFHLQVTASGDPGANPEKNMFSAIPDIDLLDSIVANQDPNWIVVTLRSIGEMAGDKTAQPGDQNKSWMNLTFDVPDQRDGNGLRRAWVNLQPTADDLITWSQMEAAALNFAKALVANPADMQIVSSNRDKIGSTHHEAGTLWMGTAPGSSITNTSGRFHHVDNAYVAGPALFPTLGSANPSLTALTLARRTASAIIGQLRP